jgi:hypothetical protein
MLLVDREFRSRGIGRALLRQAIQHLDSRGVPCLKLDATPQGKPLYEKLGFVDEYEIERWELKREPPEPKSGAPARHFAEILQLDREVFGADRSALLQALGEAAPEFVEVLVGPTGVSAYSFGRHGSHSDQLGPWVAKDESGAGQLLDTFLGRSARASIVVDCLKANAWARGALRARGFKLARPLARMRRGENAYPGRPEMVCAILGPEFG